MTNWSLDFAPLLPLPFYWAAIAVALLLVVVLFWRGSLVCQSNLPVIQRAINDNAPYGVSAIAISDADPNELKRILREPIRWADEVRDMVDFAIRSDREVAMDTREDALDRCRSHQ